MRDNMATNKVYCSYQEIIDLHTEPEKVTAIGIHTPTDDTPYKMFEGFFKQFKKYKYIGASVSLVPVATLPIDPLQVEFPGNEGVDPRDIMNPVLFHGCHGEDMGTVLNMLIGRDIPISDSLIGMQGNNADGASTSESLLYSLLDELYYKALTDRTWRKAHPQRGFRKSGLRPLLYTLATNRQVAPGSLSDVLGFNDDDDVVAFGGDPTIADRTIINPVTGTEITVPTYATKNNMQLMTPRLTRLGYLDTRMLVTDFTPGVATVDTMVTSENWTRLPKLMMGLILLPPSYKVEMHFRMIINHYWTFKGFRGISFRNDLLKSPSYFNANEDLFANESGNGNPIPEQIDSGSDVDPDDPDDGGSGGGDDGGDDGPISGAVVYTLSNITADNLSGYLKLEQDGGEYDGYSITIRELVATGYTNYPRIAVLNPGSGISGYKLALIVKRSSDVYTWYNNTWMKGDISNGATLTQAASADVTDLNSLNLASAYTGAADASAAIAWLKSVCDSTTIYENIVEDD